MIQKEKDDDREVTPYEVAQLICLQGYTAATAARKLFPDEYGDKKKQAQAITKTKRLLQRAVRDRLIRLYPPKIDGLNEALEARYPLMRSFTVVGDESVPDYSTKASPVFAEAARRISDRIATLVKESPPGKTIVVANAGGVTLGQVISDLRPIAEVPEGSNRLCFIALNAASRANAYNYSANYLAVQMAQLYGGSHIAVIDPLPPEFKTLYREALENVDLVLTSTGTRKSFLFLWPVEEFGGYPDKDQRAVGDISFVLVDANGKEVPLEDEFGPTSDEVRTYLKPEPSYTELAHLARLGKVFVVSAQLPPPLMLEHQDADYGPRARARVAHAVCVVGLASDCVLGSTVAEYLVRQNFTDEVHDGSAGGKGP